MPSVLGLILESFEAIRDRGAISPPERASYEKWLKYFLDFYAGYAVPEAGSDQVRLFIDKLREKKQAPPQQDQAAHAVSLYFETQRKGEIQAADCHASPGSESGTEAKTSSVQGPRQARERFSSLPRAIALPDRSPGLANTTSFISPTQRRPWRRWEDDCVVASASPEWDAVIAGLAAEIKTRHYSRKTLETYGHWSRRSQRSLQDKPPKSPSAKDVKEYPTCLAVQCASRHPRGIRHGLEKPRHFMSLGSLPASRNSLHDGTLLNTSKRLLLPFAEVPSRICAAIL